MPDKTNRTRIPTVNTIFTALWIAILLAGLTLKFTADRIGWPHMSKAELMENRTLSPMPEFRKIPVKTWGRATEAWYNDHFVFRNDIIDFYRKLHFEVFKSPVKRQVPGRGDWIFSRMGNDGRPGDVWPEVEDYMGIVRLDEKMIDDWTTLFEGRVAWAEAHGIHYLEVIPPMKSNVHPEKMLPMITAHRREACHEDLIESLARSTASTNVLFLLDSLLAEVASGHEVYYEEDHHENAYGCYCIYRDIAARLRELWYPELGEFRFYESDDVPEDVRNGMRAGCWVTDTRRLEISNPGMKVSANPALGIKDTNRRFPHGAMCVTNEAGGINLLVGHDSFLRYPFRTWHDKDMTSFSLPFGSGIGKASMLIFTRFTTPKLDEFIAKELPDVIIEQFSSGRLQFGTNGKGFDFLDDTMRRAAAWSHGVPMAPDSSDGATNAMAMAVLDDVRSSPTKKPVTVELLDENGELHATATALPGLRRAVFFGDVRLGPGLHIVLPDGSARSVRLELRKR